MKTINDARPCPLRARQLVTQMDLSLLATLKYLISVAANGLNENFAHVLSIVDQAHHSVSDRYIRLRGALYSINAELEHALRLGQGQRVRAILQALAGIELLTECTTTHGLASGTIGKLEEECLLSTINREFTTTYGEPFAVTAPEHLEHSRDCLHKALDALAELDPELSSEVSHYVTDIVLCKSEQIHAGSSFRAFGLVYLRELRPSQHWTTYLEHITHEAAHLHLYCLWKNDSIVLNEGSGRFSSPLRKEPRPLSGIYHAMFVLARLLYLSRLVDGNPKYRQCQDHWVTTNNNAGNSATLAEKFCDSYWTIKNNADLTALGRELAESAREMADVGI